MFSYWQNLLLLILRPQWWYVSIFLGFTMKQSKQNYKTLYVFDSCFPESLSLIKGRFSLYNFSIKFATSFALPCIVIIQLQNYVLTISCGRLQFYHLNQQSFNTLVNKLTHNIYKAPSKSWCNVTNKTYGSSHVWIFVIKLNFPYLENKRYSSQGTKREDLQTLPVKCVYYKAKTTKSAHMVAHKP